MDDPAAPVRRDQTITIGAVAACRAHDRWRPRFHSLCSRSARTGSGSSTHPLVNGSTAKRHANCARTIRQSQQGCPCKPSCVMRQVPVHGLVAARSRTMRACTEQVGAQPRSTNACASALRPGCAARTTGSSGYTPARVRGGTLPNYPYCADAATLAEVVKLQLAERQAGSPAACVPQFFVPKPQPGSLAGELTTCAAHAAAGH